MDHMYITDYSLNDPDDQPGDIYDFEFWLTVTVGDEEGGTNFQVHVCTTLSIKYIHDKKGCFITEEWEGLPRLVAKMNEFLAKLFNDRYFGADAYFLLSKHWLWEYEGM